MPTIAAPSFVSEEAPASVPPPARAGAWTPPAPALRVVRQRRPNRAWETEKHLVDRALPAGSVRAGHGWQVMRALREHPDYALMNNQRRTNLAKLLSALIAAADYQTMTTRPGWAALGEAVGCSRSSVHRHLVTLQSMGLLGVVATGRSAAFAAAGPDGERINEAAVYVLAYPSPIGAVRQVIGGRGDKVGTPPAVGVLRLKKEDLPTHAREEKPQMDAAPPRRSARGGYAATPNLPAPRTLVHWPTNRTPASKIQRRAAASQLQLTALALRVLSPADVASCCRDFFLSGWTVADILHAIDHHPTSGRHPMQALGPSEQASRVRSWLRWRLGQWRGHDGEPVSSRSQRHSAEQRQARALAAAERERITTERQLRAQTADSPAKRAALAQIRAELDRAKQRQRRRS